MQPTAHPHGTKAELAKAKLAHARATHYVLKLYVAGLTPRSLVAIRAVKQVCEGHLRGRYDLEVLDISRHPTLAKREQIVAVPMLIKKLPLPLRRLIGNMADEQKILVGLDIQP